MKWTAQKTAWVTVAAVVLVVWFCLNPPGRFGLCRFAWTTYNCIPHPLGDIQVRADGEVRRVKKGHSLSLEQVKWLLDPAPEIMIIAIGWNGIVTPDDSVRTGSGCEVRILKTGEAIELFNSLKGEKRKVAIHLHSTC